MTPKYTGGVPTYNEGSDEEILALIKQAGTTTARAIGSHQYVIHGTVTEDTLRYMQWGMERDMIFSVDSKPFTKPPPEPEEDASLEVWFKYYDYRREWGFPIKLSDLTKRINAISKIYRTKPLTYSYCRELHALWGKTGKLRKQYTDSTLNLNYHRITDILTP